MRRNSIPAQELHQHFAQAMRLHLHPLHVQADLVQVLQHVGDLHRRHFNPVGLQRIATFQVQSDMRLVHVRGPSCYHVRIGGRVPLYLLRPALAGVETLPRPCGDVHGCCIHGLTFKSTKEKSMGQAKNRGTAAQRAQQAIARERAKLPASVKCDNCQADLPDIWPFKTQGFPGLQAAAWQSNLLEEF